MEISSKKELHCIFYSHPWSVLELKNTGLLNDNNDVLVELAQASFLRQVLTAESAFQKLSITHALHGYNPFESTKKKLFFSLFSEKKPDALASSALRFNDLPAPLVLAPREQASPALQISGLLSALALGSRFKKIIALIHYHEAELFSGIFSYVDQFDILWDCADLPDCKLSELTSLLSKHQVTKERWGEFRLCQSPTRMNSEHEKNYLQYQQIINEIFN
jgi:hypothetical protein